MPHLTARDDVLDKSCVMQVRRNPTHTVMRLSRKGGQVVAEMRPDGRSEIVATRADGRTGRTKPATGAAD